MSPMKTHHAIMRLGQRTWAKILKANRYETAGSQAAGVLRGHVPWPWERWRGEWHLDDNRRPWFVPGASWVTLPAVERLKISLIPGETLRQLEFFAWGPGPRPWIGKPCRSTLNNGVLDREAADLMEEPTIKDDTNPRSGIG